MIEVGLNVRHDRGLSAISAFPSLAQILGLLPQPSILHGGRTKQDCTGPEGMGIICRYELPTSNMSSHILLLKAHLGADLPPKDVDSGSL